MHTRKLVSQMKRARHTDRHTGAANRAGRLTSSLPTSFTVRGVGLREQLRRCRPDYILIVLLNGSPRRLLIAVALLQCLPQSNFCWLVVVGEAGRVGGASPPEPSSIVATGNNVHGAH